MAEFSPAPAMAARITGISTGGVGYVAYSTDTSGISAQIGRWDTPYPYPDTGEYAAGLEPSGYSELYINVAVEDGGIASFNYQVKTYDTGIWDWFDIYLITPNGTVTLVDHLSKPGSDYGTYWESPIVALSQDLSAWRNQNVTFVFRVQQDGWGDQTMGGLSSFDIRTCQIPPLQPITDPTALLFENGQTIDTDDLTSNMKTALDCFKNSVTNSGGNFILSSAYRPPAYQVHLQEVWDKWQKLKDRLEPECQDTKSEVEKEFLKHHLVSTIRPAGPNGHHCKGIAIDVGIRNANLPLNTVIGLAAGCNLFRPFPQKDPVHFEYRY